MLLLAATAAASAQNPGHTLLWRVSGNGLQRPSYLYGTMHVTDERAFDFADSVLLKLQECETFAMEILLDSATRYLFREVFSADTSAPDIRDWLDERQQAKLDLQLRNATGLSLEQFAHVRPWLFGQFMSEIPDAGADQGESMEPFVFRAHRSVSLDPWLYRVARAEGKKIIALESIDEQITLFDTIPYEQQVRYFLNVDDALPGGTKSEDLYESMIRSYHAGDLDALLEIMKKSSPDEIFLRRLLADRNHIMVARIVPTISSTTTFIAVGAGHLPGPEGLIELLQKKGFDVTPVQTVRTGLARHYIERPYRAEWIRFQEKAGGFSVDVPVEPIQLPGGPGGMSFLRAREFVSSDVVQGILYNISYFDLPAETRPDEAILNDFVGSLEYSDAELISSAIDSSTIYPARRAVVRQADGTINHYRMLARGKRLHVLLATTDESQADSPDVPRFLESLTLLEYPTPVLRPVTSDTLGIRARLPGQPEISFDTSDSPIFRTTIHGISFDTLTPHYLQIERYTFSRFFRRQNDEVLLMRELEMFRQENDTLYSVEMSRHGKDPALDVEIGIIGQHIVRRIRMVRHGRDIYHLTLHLPRNLARSPMAEDLLASFELTGERVESPTGNRIPEIAALLDSLDTSIEIDPALGMFEIELDSEEIAYAYDLLKRPRYDDNADMGLRMLLLANLANNADSTIIPHLMEIYLTLQDLPTHRYLVRYLLAVLHTEEANRLLADLLAGEEQGVAQDVEILSDVVTVDASTMHALVPGVLPLLHDVEMRNHVLWILLSTLDMGTLLPAEIEREWQLIVELTDSAIKQSDDNAAQMVVLGMQVLERLPPTERSLELMRATLDNEQNYYSYIAALALVRLEQPITTERFDRFAADPSFRLDLYRRLDAMNRLDLFPRSYLTQRSISEAALVEWIINDQDAPPDTITFLDALDVTVGGTTQRALLFKFRYADEGSDWMVGLGSLQPADPEQIDPTDLSAASLYNKVGSLSRREHVDALLDQ